MAEMMMRLLEPAIGPQGGPPQMKIATYTGDGNATLGVTGVGFTPVYVIIYPQADVPGVTGCRAHKTSSDGLLARLFERAAGPGNMNSMYEADQIISLDADGFTVGDGTGDLSGANLLNILARVYTYIAFPVTGGFSSLATGSYAGDGAATQAIAGVGFQPKTVYIYQIAGPSPSEGYKTDQDGLNAHAYYQGGVDYCYSADLIISLDAGGFTVGDGGAVGNLLNLVGNTYNYLCWA